MTGRPGEGQRNFDEYSLEEANIDLETRKKEMLDRAENTRFFDDKEKGPKGQSLREFIHDYYLDNERNRSQKILSTPIGMKIRQRFPTVEDRDILIKAYKENFSAEEIGADIFHKYRDLKELEQNSQEKGYKFSWSQGKKLQELSEQIDALNESRDDLVDFMARLNSELDDEKHRVSRLEVAQKAAEEAERRKEERKDILFSNFNAQTLEHKEGYRPITVKKLNDYTERLGDRMFSISAEDPHEKFKELEEDVKKLSDMLIKFYPDPSDRKLLKEKIDEEEKAAHLAYKNIEAENKRHEQEDNDPQKVKEINLEKEYLRLSYIKKAVEAAI